MADYEYITDTGSILPDTSTVLTEVQNAWKAAYGSDLVVTSDTPQGVMIAMETEARITFLQNNADLANQFNPNYSGGIYVDAICALTGIERTKQTYSSVDIDMTGESGSLVPTSVTVEDDNGFLWSPVTATILTTGTVTTEFKCKTPGAIAAPAGSITQIMNGVPGLETVNNPDDAILGATTQGDMPLKLYRKDTIAANGSQTGPAVTSGLYLTANVRSVKYRENFYNTVRVVDGVTMQPKTIYVCVDGGTDDDIAATLTDKKGAGCGYSNGTGTPVSVEYTAEYSGQVFEILFDRPIEIPILIKVTVKVLSPSGDTVQVIKDAIMNYVNGLDNGQPGFKVGESVSSFELSGAISRAAPGLYIVKVETTKEAVINYSTDEILIAIYQLATTDEDSISVVIL
jgi:hypothetical protein